MMGNLSVAKWTRRECIVIISVRLSLWPHRLCVFRVRQIQWRGYIGPATLIAALHVSILVVLPVNSRPLKLEVAKASRA